VEPIPYLLETLAHFTVPGGKQEDDLTIVALARLPDR
jgi:hypothetical protein